MKFQIIWSRDRPRPLLFENCNQRFPPLAKRVAPVCLYQNIDPTKCLRHQLGMIRGVTIGRCNWCSLTSASPPLTNILDGTKTFIVLASFQPFSREDYLIVATFWTYYMKTVCALSGGNFYSKDFSIKQGVDGHAGDTGINNSLK